MASVDGWAPAKDISGWAASATTHSDNDSDSDDEEGQMTTGGPSTDWTKVADVLRRGRVKERREELTSIEKLAKNGEIPATHLAPVVGLLLSLTTRYSDLPSTVSLVNALSSLSTTSTDDSSLVLGKWAKWAKAESTQRSPDRTTAASSQYHLLLHLAAIVQVWGSSTTKEEQWQTLIPMLAVTLDAVLDEEYGAKTAVRQAAVKRVRKLFRMNSSLIVPVFQVLTSTASDALAPRRRVPLLGLVVDVCLHLRVGKETEKGAVGGIGRGYIDASKAVIIETWRAAVADPSPAPSHVRNALRDFFASCLTPEEIEAVAASVEKIAVRAPTSSFQALESLISPLTLPLPAKSETSMVALVFANTKSAKSEDRAAAVHFFGVLAPRMTDVTTREKAGDEIVTVLKSGKFVSADHRAALYALLRILPPSATFSSKVAAVLPGLIPKENTAEAGLAALLDALSPHLAASLSAGVAIPAPVLAAFTKELATPKAVNRRLVVGCAGETLWLLCEMEKEGAWNAEAAKFGDAVAKALADGSLKTVAAGPLTVTGGVGEGFIAVATLLGPLSKSGSKPSSVIIAGNPILQAIATTSPKPSFILWDKVQRKAASASDEAWLLRALRALIERNEDKLSKDESLRIHAGISFINLAFSSAHSSSRREALAVLRSLIQRRPKVFGRVLRDSLKAFLFQRESATVPMKAVAEEDTSKSPEAVAASVRQVLFTAVSFDEGTADEVKEDAVTELLVLAHHPALGAAAGRTFVDLALSARVNIAALVERNATKLTKLLWDAAGAPPKSSEFASAAFAAAKSLAFISPQIFVPEILAKVTHDLDPQHLDFIGTQELGIWATPDGTAFVDVLALKKTAPTPAGNRATAAMDKWEQEVRESAAAKKKAAGGAPTISKADQALINAQLATESETRAKIARVQSEMIRGLALIRSLVYANTDLFKAQLTDAIQAILNGPLEKGAFLVGEEAFRTFLLLGECCSSRLGLMRPFVGVAILRNYGVKSIPEEMQAESLSGLVIRVLYRLRALSEQSPFDAATYAYVTPLLTTVIAKGGAHSDSEGEEDTTTEQLALALEVMNFHCGEFSDTAFPRLSTISDILQLIGTQPVLRKDAASALIDLGEAIKDNASNAEIDALIKGTLSSEVVVRNATLQALQPLDLTELDYSNELWIACHDDDAQNARLARHLWEDNGLDVSDTFPPLLLPFLEYDNSYVRSACAHAFAEGVAAHPETLEDVITALEELYVERAKILAPEFDEFGMIREESLDRSDPFHIRLAVGHTFTSLAPYYTPETLVPFFEFLVKSEALGDRSGAVRRAMLDAGAAVIDAHGQVKLGELIQVFETNLSSKSSTEAGDHISEALVILFGRLASFLDKSDPRISKVVDRLVEALKTPSEAVQAAVSDCIPALVKRMQPEVPGLVARLYDLLIHGKKYAERRGAAYGLAGVVKGRGLSAIKEFDLIDKLREAAKDKESFMSRQGALLAFETLSATLGRVFEPYVLAILPLLLSSFGDDTADVREATQDASRVMMSRLSGHCVNIVLPSLLEGLEEKQWRTKKGSIELLGAMAFCAPRQLAQSLPTIIPELTAVLTDSHAQVRKAANASLKKFGEVIHNPEIKALVPTLLKALVDPTGKTTAALGALLNTSFAHFIDSPSLALVAPIIERGLRERSATSKRKAVQILGNLSSLTDPKDFTPYLITFLPLVHIVLVDPVPEARATAAKALGTLVERLGEVNFPDLVQQLLQTLRSDTSGVDRQGAAQGLSEVLSGLGMDRLEALLPEIITNASSPRPYVREGFISLLVYLPATFGHRFAPHLGRIIPPILSGLADESEFVREASMRAGKMIISNYSTKAVDLLLPELEKGMVDENWRIRQSSIQLIGELLFRITGISGKAEIEEEEGAETGGVDSTRKVLLDVLGQEKRDRVLSTLYVVRQDAVNAVRTGSIHIWKALVQNTPRTLREILPSVINMVISLLSSPGHEQKETASRTLAELCRKNGDRILQDMVPILRQSVTSSNPALREGGCLAFAELLDSAADYQLEEHQNAIIAAIRTALIDENADVRAAAARVFDQMSQGEFGTKAIDQTVPTLLEALRTPGESSETALRAIKEVMSVRANTIFPVVIPTLIAHPISAFNARALGSLVSVAGGALSRRLAQILTPIAKALETEKDEEILAEIRDTMRTLMQSVEDQEGIHSLMMILLGWARSETPARRVTGLQCFRTFCEVTEEDFADYRVDWVRQLISAFADRELTVVEAAWEALEALVKSVPKDELEDLVVPLRSSIEATAAPGNEVAGFSRPKGVQSVVPILLAGVLGGTHEQREQAAGGIGDLVLRTSEPGIKPYIVQLTGPLIRVISSQTFPPAVKNAILGTLTILLQRVPHLVRPFQPQLQRTFVKSVSDPASISIRNHAAEGLGVLMVSQTRVDPLITELVAGARLPESEIASSMVHALACVATSAGNNFGAASKTAVEELVLETFENSRTDAYIEAMSRVVGGLALHDVEAVRPVFDRVLSGKPSALTSLTILSTLNAAPATFESLGMKEQIVKKVLASCAVVDNPSVGRPAREAREAFRAMGDEAVLALLEG